ncbi:MAG: CHAT domain-containing protein [Archangium sp.]
MRSASAFARGDYSSCVDALPALARRHGWTLPAIQLFLIALARTEDDAGAQRAAEHFERVLPDPSWERAVTQLTLGRGTVDATLALARTESQRVATRYYAGELALTAARFDVAREYFRSLADTGTSLEASLAEANLQLLDQPEATLGLGLQRMGHLLARDRTGLTEVLDNIEREAERVPVDRRALAISSLGVQLLQADVPAAAERFLRQALDLKRRSRADAASLSMTRHNLAGACNRLRKFEEAEALYREELAEERPSADFEGLQQRVLTIAALGHVVEQRRGPAAEATTLEEQAGVLRDALGQELETSLWAIAMAQAENSSLPLAVMSARLSWLVARSRPRPNKRTIDAARKLLGGLLGTHGGLLAAKDPRAALGFLRESLTHLADEPAKDRAMMKFAVARLLRDTGELDQAAPLFHESICALDELGEGVALEASLVRNSLGVLLVQRGDAAEARPILERALELVTKAGGDPTSILANLGMAHRALGQLDRACEVLSRCVEEAERDAAGHELVLVEALSTWSRILLEDRRQPVAAIPVLERRLAVLQLAGAPELEQVSAMIGLGLAERMAGRYDAARARFDWVLSRRDSISPAQLAETYNALGLLEVRLGRFVAAELALAEALRCGRQEPDLRASILNTQATLFEALGDFDRAAKHYLSALDTLESAGVQDKLFNTILGNFALARLMAGDLVQAQDLYERLAERHRATGAQMSLAATLRNLSIVYERTALLAVSNGRSGDAHFARSAELLGEALDGTRRAGPPDAQSLFLMLQGLGWYAFCRGDFAAAEHLYAQASEHSRQLSERSEGVVRAHANRAWLLAATDRRKEALELMLDHARAEDTWIDGVFELTSEALRLDYARRSRGNLDFVLSLALELADDRAATNSALDYVLRRKGIVADAMAAPPQRGDEPPQVAAARSELGAVRAAVAAIAMGWPADQASDVDELVGRKEALERVLATAGPGARGVFARVDRAGIAQHLPTSSALVELVRFRHFSLKAIVARESRWTTYRYAAFVLVAGHPEDARFVDLGEAAPIEAALERWRQVSIHPSQTSSPEKPWVLPGQDLRRLVFDPIAAASGVKQMFIAPDGDMSQLPFEALSTDDGDFLIDTYAISYLSTGRDVLRLARTSGAPPSPAVVAVDPDFDLRAQDPKPSTPSALRSAVIGDLVFEPLPATRAEGDEVAKLLQVVPMVGAEVNKKALLDLQSPIVLHIATHGFFLAQPGAGGEMSSSPMLRSGLALAGANCRRLKFTPPAEAGDGLLTAEDVTSLDLRSTELVVLSACETGVGLVQAGEGVFGLRRAFILAGARTLVMSLWRVPDQQTSELMQAFYWYLIAGAGRAEALRAAARSIRKTHAAPFYWAAFVCQGDAGPLQLERLT